MITTDYETRAYRDLTLVTTVKAELGILSIQDDALLQTLVTHASDSITSYCNRSFVFHYVKELIPTEAQQAALVLEHTPVHFIESITAIPEGGKRYACDLDEELAQLGASSGVITARAYRRWPKGCVEVYYATGYITPKLASLALDQKAASLPYGGRYQTLAPPLPQDIERAAIEWVKALYLARSRDPMVTFESVMEISRTHFATTQGIPPTAALLLNPWRRFL